MVIVNVQLKLDVTNALHTDFLLWIEQHNHYVTDAVLLGYHIINNGLVDAYCRSSTSNNIIKKHQIEMDDKEKQIEHIASQLRNSHERFDVELKSRMDELTQLYKDQISTLKDALMMRENSINTIVTEQVDVLRKQLADRETEIQTLKASNHVKGFIGERILVSYLQEHFPTFETENRGKHANESDIHMVNPMNELYVVESKYKDRITNLDIDKFYRDVTILSTTRTVLGGVFVSIKSRSIPTKGSLSFEQRNGIPLMFIAFDNQEELESSFKRYMQLFIDVSILMVGNAEENDNNDHENIIKRLELPFGLIKKNKTRIEKIRNEHMAAINKLVLELEHDNLHVMAAIEELIAEDAPPHKQQKTHECAICKRTYKTPSGLKTHVKMCRRGTSAER